MKHIFAFEHPEDMKTYQDLVNRFRDKLDEYQQVLQEQYALCDVPKGIVWPSEDLATSFFSRVPIPAFTNKDIIYMSPDLAGWRAFFLEVMEGYHTPRIKEFYANMQDIYLLAIAGHELTHHSDLFVDEFDDERENSIWFEEGMCDYLSRKYLLTESEFKSITAVETEQVKLLKERFGDQSLDEFGIHTYQGSITSIMYNYWRSFLAVKYLVEVKADHDVHQVFNAYHTWHHEGRKMPLTRYFELDASLF
ncbi:hypothetical protein V1498_05680 [Peribacillus sp. SCS-26]|uniref:hypothetical protein n=1 Tax=Paraperibacillus marinus TaxID=3115295 RepID=UPI0039065A8F